MFFLDVILSIFCEFHPSGALGGGLKLLVFRHRNRLGGHSYFSELFLGDLPLGLTEIKHALKESPFFFSLWIFLPLLKKTAMRYQVLNLKRNVFLGRPMQRMFLCYRKGPSLVCTLRYFVISSF